MNLLVNVDNVFYEFLSEHFNRVAKHSSVKAFQTVPLPGRSSARKEGAVVAAVCTWSQLLPQLQWQKNRKKHN